MATEDAFHRRLYQVISTELSDRTTQTSGMRRLEALSGAGEVRVSTLRADGCVEVSVSDTGPGIPADKRENVFEDFFTTKATGTGLGLGIVKRVMDRHGGAVRLTSEPGKGTTVGLTFSLGAAR